MRAVCRRGHRPLACAVTPSFRNAGRWSHYARSQGTGPSCRAFRRSSSPTHETLKRSNDSERNSPSCRRRRFGDLHVRQWPGERTRASLCCTNTTTAPHSSASFLLELRHSARDGRRSLSRSRSEDARADSSDHDRDCAISLRLAMMFRRGGDDGAVSRARD
jgi:hypothetical protein